MPDWIVIPVALLVGLLLPLPLYVRFKNHLWTVERYEKRFDATWMRCSRCEMGAWDDRICTKPCTVGRILYRKYRKFRKSRGVSQ